MNELINAIRYDKAARILGPFCKRTLDIGLWTLDFARIRTVLH